MLATFGHCWAVFQRFGGGGGAVFFFLARKCPVYRFLGPRLQVTNTPPPTSKLAFSIVFYIMQSVQLKLFLIELILN